MVAGGSLNAGATAIGLSVNRVTLKWTALLLFGGQLILVSGGVMAMLLLEQVQHDAVVSADLARHAQLLEANYFAGMIEAEGGLQEYIDTGDPASLTAYNDGLVRVSAAGTVLRHTQTDAGATYRLDMMFAEAEAWKGYATRVLNPLQSPTPDPNTGDVIFDSFTAARQSSTVYLERQVSRATAAESLASSRQLLTLGVIGAVALVSVISGGVLIQRSTLQPMAKLIRSARELAAGGRTELPPSSNTGEIGDLSRALHSWQRLSEKRTAVQQAMHAVSGRVDRDEIIGMGLERLFDVSDAAEVAVILIGDGGTVMTTMTWDTGVQEPRTLPPASPLQALLDAGANLVGDWSDEPWPEKTREWAKGRGYGPLALVMMVSGSKPVGAVAATRAIGRPAFDVVDVSLVEAIAAPLAAAIRVAALFDEVRAVSAELDLANRHKTDFLSSMSHELRTPLNSILGFADLLITPGFDAVTAKQARYIANIHASGIHLASLLNDALDLAKVESGKAELDLQRVDVANLVAEVVMIMQPLAMAARVKLLAPAGSPGEIAADRRKLHQVLLNLLSNAIKFTPPEGSVTIAAQRADGDLLLTVSDTGIGVAGEDLERIFGAFEQVSGANRDGGGTGLGLALSRQYVELHGGRIWLESEVGRGSHFHVSLPVSGVPTPAPGAGASPQMAVLLQK
jgi:signal transduction histidine kinase